MVRLARSCGVCGWTFRKEALLPHARNLIGLARRYGRTDMRTRRKFDTQEVQHCANRFLIIAAELFIFHFKRFDYDPSEEIVSDFLLAFSFVQ